MYQPATKSRDAYQLVNADQGPDETPEPPEKSSVIMFLTSGFLRLIMLAWISYILWGCAVSWYSVTAYHLQGPEIREDEGLGGNLYDVTRTVSKQALSSANYASNMMNSKKPQAGLSKEDFEIVNEDTPKLYGWRASLIYGWLVCITAISTILALAATVVFLRNLLITCCHIERLNASEEVREKRMQLAGDVALVWQLLLPTMSWLIEKITGIKNCGVAPHLFNRIAGLALLACIAQKLLATTQAGLKEAIRHLDGSADIAWTVCTHNDDSKLQNVKQCANNIHEKAHFLTFGPVWFQRLFGGLVVVGVFKTRPYGELLALFGLIDKVIVSRISMLLLGLIPAWIDADIKFVERELRAAEQAGAKMMKAKLHGMLSTIAAVFDSARTILDEAVDEMEKLEQKVLQLKGKHSCGRSTDLLRSTTDKVKSAFKALDEDVTIAVKEIGEVQADVERSAALGIEKITSIIEAMIAHVDRMRPVNLLKRLRQLEDKALYDMLIGYMADCKGKGAKSLAFAPSNIAP